MPNIRPEDGTCFDPQMGIKLQRSQEFRMNKWSRLYRDLRALPSRQAGRLLMRKASKGWRARKAEISAKRQIRSIQNDLGSPLVPGQVLHDLLDSKFTRLNGFPITPDRTRETAALLNQRFPDWVARCIGSANRICENRISLLGHEIHLEEPPAWHNDHISGAVWPTQHSGQLLNLRMNHGSDIKFVWELSRFHHGVTLARAFALTTDERFARKFLSLFNDWLKANPPYAGPNWTCAMEVAIRAVNLLWAGSLLVSSAAFDRRAREAFIKTLLVHGAFIYHNLEYDVRAVGRSLQPVNGNHYLADLSGLLYLSCAFPECRFASVWREFAQRELFREIRSQVDEEGVHWEYSPGYHRLVLEMILSCLILLERQSVTIPEDIREKASKMLDFIRHYTKPSGGVPLVRDIDNGRFCILGEEELSSHDHLLALGAIYFDRPDLYPGQLFEDCLWYLGPRACEWHKREPAPSPSPPRMECAGERGSSIPYRQASRTGPSASSKLYRQSGFCVMRHDSHYLLAVCSPKGMQGYCGHTHNDFLSFELEAFGRTFLTDCGSYVYSQSPEWRNRMRSTASHNTVVLDGLEQNRFAIINKTHHSLVDGVSGVDLTTVLFDTSPTPTPVSAERGAILRMSTAETGAEPKSCGLINRRDRSARRPSGGRPRTTRGSPCCCRRPSGLRAWPGA